MPAVRFSRDKRGYEYIYLVHTPTRRGKPGRTRVLYWYRTPPGVRIGRKPFDEEVQRTVEQQNPGVTFDWPAIIKAEMPPPDMTEFWRERRRMEKAARQERRAAEAEEAGEAAELQSAEALDVAPIELVSEVVEPESAVDAESSGSDASAEPGAGGDDAAQAGPAPKKRRRRRGGRRRKGAAGATDSPEAGQAEVEAGATGDGGSDDSADEPSE